MNEYVNKLKYGTNTRLCLLTYVNECVNKLKYMTSIIIYCVCNGIEFTQSHIGQKSSLILTTSVNQAFLLLTYVNECVNKLKYMTSIILCWQWYIIQSITHRPEVISDSYDKCEPGFSPSHVCKRMCEQTKVYDKYYIVFAMV